MIEKKSSKKTGKEKKIKKIPGGEAICACKISFNNTIISLCKKDGSGDVIKQESGGSVGFKGAKKGTDFAAQKVAEKIIKLTSLYGISSISLQTKGIGVGRNAVIRKFLESQSLNVEEMADKTPIPLGGGCRPRKRPRK
jgi:small subunit ribosomal protein S11